MQKFLLSAALVAMSLSAAAATTTISFKEFDALKNVEGTEVAEDLTTNPVTYRQYNPLEGFTASDYVFSFAKGEGTTDPALYSSKAGTWSLRVYKKNTMTIEAPEGTKIGKMTFDCSHGAENFTATADKGTCTYTYASNAQTLVWASEEPVSSVTLTIGEGSNIRMYSVVMDTEGGTVEPPVVDDAIFSNTLTTEAEFALFTVEAKVESEFGAWHLNGKPACAIANSYDATNKVNLPAESWLVSPVVDLKDYTNCTLDFEQAFGFDFPQNAEEAGEWYVVKVKEEGSDTWTDMAPATYPEKPEKNWSAFVANSLDIKAFDGKKIQFAFAYKNDGSKSRAWEIQNVKVNGTKAGAVEVVADENAEAVYYDLAGRKVLNPAAGIYVKVQGNKATKVVLR